MNGCFEVKNKEQIVTGFGFEKKESVFSKLASNINSIKNSIVKFFSEKKTNDPIKTYVDLEEINRNKNVENNRKALFFPKNKQVAKKLQDSIQDSNKKFTKEIANDYFYKNDETQNKNNNLFCNTEMAIDNLLLENEEGSNSYTSTPYFYSISNQNSFNN